MRDWDSDDDQDRLFIHKRVGMRPRKTRELLDNDRVCVDLEVSYTSYSQKRNSL
jgi:hypothetical protein